MEIERRITDAPHAEVRAVKRDNGQPAIRGYAAVFNSTSKRMKTPQGRVFVERIAPGAFSDALTAGDDTKATIQHDPNTILGRRSKGTLTLREDDKGLVAEIDPPDTTLGNDTITQVERGDLDKMSFAFRTAEDAWDRQGDGSYVRTLKKIGGLVDVTLTDRPAYGDTSVSLRMADEAIDKMEGAAATGVTIPVTLDTSGIAEKVTELRALLDTVAPQFRATMTVQDNSLVYASRCAVTYFRYAFDACNQLIDTCAAINGDLSDADQRAV
jgi:HK97 family phage prohead protease